MDLEQDARRLLDQLDVLRHPSDLDLLIFFARHPRALLASEHIAAFLGYGVKDIAASLDLLLDAGFLTRTPNRRHAARMYVFAVNPPGGGWLPALRRLGSTRQGRLALIWEIRRRSSGGTGGHAAPVDRDESPAPGPLRFPQSGAMREVASSKPSTERTPPTESRKGGGHGGER